jgi:hypothetical protein
MNEIKLKEVIDYKMADEKSFIESYSFTSSNVNRQFKNPGDDEVKEFIKGDGLRWSNGKIGNLFTQAVECNIIDSVRTKFVWYPEWHAKEPFGSGTKVYDSKQVVEMIYDLEESAEHDEPFDILQILSQKPNPGDIVHS